MNNYKMTVQYDGTRYSGWQRQGNTAQTIQYKLEQALGRLLDEPVEVSGSGRTDAGVHALGQVANFKTEKVISCEEFLIRLNGALPEDIAVTSLSLASPRFHARLGAKEKTYRYTVNMSPVQDVFRRRYEYQLPGPLDLAAMEQAANLLLGTHDFRGFSTGHTKKSTVRYLKSIEFVRDGNKLYITFTGNGFLYNMVRILTGTLIEVGQGTRNPDSVLTVFETKDRQLAGYTAPAQGLCLMHVTY
jgi:tRNA pseudouridine38-40 synthase